MTDLATPETAQRSRANCRPKECDERAGCWVEQGRGASTPAPMGSPKCRACRGLIMAGRWRASVFFRKAKP